MEDKIAIKSGYYFKLFNRNEVNIELKEIGTKIKYDDKVYKLYGATKLEDERKIDDMFGNEMGQNIEEYELKKPKCALIGADGNIFNLMGMASRTLKRNDMREESEEMINRVTSSHSYDEALCIIGEYVDITDQAGLEEEEELD